MQKKSSALPSLAAAAVLMLLMIPTHAGFMLYFVILPMLFWLPYSIYVICRLPERRRLQSQKIAIWLGMIAIVAGVHVIRHQITRHNADKIVAAIQNYSAAHGHCPAALTDIHLNPQQLKDQLGSFSSYSCEDGKPSLFYAVPYIIFDTYHYDFQHNIWQYFD